MRLLVSILLNGLFVLLLAEFLPGVYVEGYVTAIIAGLALGLVNFFVKPIVTILTLPISILTLGIFLLIINGAMVLLTDWLVSGFDVQGLGWAVIFSVLLAILNTFIGGVKADDRK